MRRSFNDFLNHFTIYWFIFIYTFKHMIIYFMCSLFLYIYYWTCMGSIQQIYSFLQKTLNRSKWNLLSCLFLFSESASQQQGEHDLILDKLTLVLVFFNPQYTIQGQTVNLTAPWSQALLSTTLAPLCDIFSITCFILLEVSAPTVSTSLLPSLLNSHFLW